MKTDGFISMTWCWFALGLASAFSGFGANPGRKELSHQIVIPMAAPQIPVRLNEVQANNVTLTNADGTVSDWVELFNPSANAVDLSDLSLSDDPANPRKWIFPAGSSISANNYLVIRCAGTAPVSMTNTGFGLSATGDAVYFFDRPANGAGLVDSATFGLQVPDLAIGRVPNGSGAWVLTSPTHGLSNVAAGLGDVSALKVNEWMANPSLGDDWFEIFNPNNLPVNLSGLFLTDDLKNRTQSPIPPLSFIGAGANGYVKFIADGAPAKGADHAGFKLSASGESIGIFTANGLQIDAVTFGPQTLDVSQGRLPDGSANIVSFAATPSPGESNYLPNVVINEVLTHTDPPLEDAIELFNPTSQPAAIGGWYLSNTPNNLKKYRIPDGAVVPANGFKVFYEYQFNPAPGSSTSFTLNSAHGDDVILSSADASGNLTGYRAQATFGAAENGVSFGRYQTSAGVDFVAMTRRTFGADNPVSSIEFRTGTGLPNANPKVGPVVINEIMFHPISGSGTNATENPDEEFIELLNLTPNPLLLYDALNRTNTWRLSNAVEFNFPANITLAPNEYLLLVSFDPALNTNALLAFRTKYGVASSVTILGPFSGRLDNAIDSIELYKPDPPQLPPHPDAGFVPYVLVDRVQYQAATPWPAGASGTGFSLQRKNAAEYGNDPINWLAAAPTAGRDNASGAGSTDSDSDGLPDSWELANGFNPNDPRDAALDSDGDGMSNLAEYIAGTDPRNSSSSLKIEASLNGVNGTFVVRFTAIAGKTYSVQSRSSLTSGTWAKLGDVNSQSETRVVEIADSIVANGPARFYRLVTPQLP